MNEPFYIPTLLWFTLYNILTVSIGTTWEGYVLGLTAALWTDQILRYKDKRKEREWESTE